MSHLWYRGVMNIINNEINTWAKNGVETLVLGQLCYRVSSMFSMLPTWGEGLDVGKKNDLGISYAIGFNSGHIEQINESGKALIVSAYNSLKDYYKSNPLQGE